MKKQQRLWRGFLYGAGLLVLTCGITLNTKTLLGVSPVISVPNCLSLLYGWKLGWLVTVLYLGCVLIQIPLKGPPVRDAGPDAVSGQRPVRLAGGAV